MAENKDHLWKPAEDAPEKIEDLVKGGSHPVGIDVGTSKVVVSRRGGKDVACASQLNAFIPVPWSPVTERTLQQQSDIHYYRDGDEIVIFGSATSASRTCSTPRRGARWRRPPQPEGEAAWPVLEAIVQSLVPKPRSSGEVLAFSVPPPPRARGAAHLPRGEPAPALHLLGYKAMAINEGLAVIFSELEDHNFTGIGVSCGGGMCNATLAFLSIPTIMVSLPKAGDFIDHSVGEAVGEHATRVKVIKEEGFDLSRDPKDKMEKALRIYYEDLVETLVDTLRRAISRAEKLPRTERALPIVLAGGTARPKGFRELFERTLRGRSFPVEVAEVRMATDPLTATARGAHIAAMFEK